MHIRIFSSETPGGLKWRGGALTEFDGKRWSEPGRENQTIPVANGHADLEPSVYRRPGRHINYHVDVDAFGTNSLFFAGVPEMVDLRYAFLLRTGTGSYRIGYQSPRGLHYDAYSRLEDSPETSPALYPAPILPLRARSDDLQLPPLDPRIPELARAMTAGAATDLERARAIEGRLRTDYGYTLELPDHEVADPLAYFLFTRKKGHCEYFASAMTVMLRTAGIPARLATGFQSGEYNPITDFWLVRASDAHAWVEAWIPGHGWTTFDPTPPDPNRRGFALLTNIGLYLDAAETFWQEWVVSYDISRQGTLADRLEQGTRRMGVRWFDSLSGLNWNWYLRVAAWFRRYGVRILIVLALGALIWVLGPPLIRLLRIRSRVERVRRGQATVGDATLLYERMLALLKRRGYQKPAWFTPSEFAATLPPTQLGTAVAEFTVKYNALRFGRRTEVAPRLSILLDELERQ
jgi:transglutaminase-like putative cysteine protease